MELPTFEHCAEKKSAFCSGEKSVNDDAVDAIGLNPLERFVYDNEPAGNNNSELFRVTLTCAIEWSINNT